VTAPELLTARNRLRDVVAVLASPPDAQEEWLRSIGVHPLADELVLELDDWMQLLPQFEREGLVDEASVQALRQLVLLADELQGKLGNTPEAWDAKRLATSPEWEAVRRAAGHALVAFVIHDAGAVAAGTPQ